jgi:hypothetical protein
VYFGERAHRLFTVRQIFWVGVRCDFVRVAQISFCDLQSVALRLNFIIGEQSRMTMLEGSLKGIIFGQLDGFPF